MSETIPTQPQPDDEARTSETSDVVALPAGKSKITHCPACKIGVLYVISYDEAATHEIGNETASQHEAFQASGGAQIVKCFHCGIQSSQALGKGGGS